MRFLLALMAMTLFAISTGCDKPEETTAEAGGSAAVTTAPEAPEVPAAPAGETQTVSLKLPNMTWGGCVGAVSTALKGLGASDVDCDLADNSCNFKVPADLDIEAKLTEIASAKNKLKDWSKVE